MYVVFTCQKIAELQGAEGGKYSACPLVAAVLVPSGEALGRNGAGEGILGYYKTEF